MNKQIVLTFLGGATVGAVTALLLAPRSGADTRKAISDGVGDALHRTQSALGAARTRVSQLPGAIGDAGSAAREAFSDHYHADSAHN